VTNYYVYYKLQDRSAESLRPAVETLFNAVHAATGVRGRWMRRRDEAGTYMEVYEGVGDEAAFERVLKDESGKLGLQRHTERFVCA
jgi:hypothetical protein